MSKDKLKEKILENTFLRDTPKEIDQITQPNKAKHDYNVHLLGKKQDGCERLKHEINQNISDFEAIGTNQEREINVVKVNRAGERI